MERESMEFDVVIVGAGPSGLAAACRLMTLAQSHQKELQVCVIEKGSEVGAHILSGAILETTAIDELFPNWKEMGAPINTPVTDDHIYLLKNDKNSRKIPNSLTPKSMHNEGNYIVSMGNVCRWLAEQAESLGVEIFPGFPAADVIIENNEVKGVITGDMGVAANGDQKDSYQPGMELRARYTLFAEGSRGHLGKQLIQHFELDKGADPQHYAIGFKEIWDIPAEQHREGLVIHTTGWPLNNESGGAYLYHAENQQVFVGLIVDLNYQNTYLSPFEEFQRLKHHPTIKQYLSGGKRISYGARSITKGGINSLPKMSFPGGFLIGCNAGTLNFSKIKGNHNAMKSGMLVAESIVNQIFELESSNQPVDFEQHMKSSWLYQDLFKSRNFGPAIHKFGKILGGAFNMIEQNWFDGRLPLTLHDMQLDHTQLKPVQSSSIINYPKPDGVISFDRLSSVFLSNTNHEEDQPCHLTLKDDSIPITINLKKYDEPAQRFCPAGVYEIIDSDSGDKKLQINAQNCIHCKTCDIKDPSQNIIWTVPEGTGGPNYPNM